MNLINHSELGYHPFPQFTGQFNILFFLYCIRYIHMYYNDKYERRGFKKLFTEYLNVFKVFSVYFCKNVWF